MSEKNRYLSEMKKGKSTRKKEEAFDYTAYEQEIVSGLMSGQDLLGEGGLLRPLIARFVESALDAEMSDHLHQESLSGKTGNKRNGEQSKELRTPAGNVRVKYSRDRKGSFEPVVVKKRQHELGTGFDAQILELYAMSNSMSDIRLHLERMYGVQMSESRISEVVNSTWEVVKMWHERKLPACYVVLFIDAVHITVKRNGVYNKVALYVLYGINVEGYREIVGLYVGQSCESATEWARCLQDLKNRGLEDVLHICSDGLSGLKEVMQEAFPLSTIQRCVVHKIRNCFSLMDDKDSRLILKQLKGVYTALNEAQARQRLEDFGAYWEGKYDCIVEMWEKDWEELMGCMQLGPALRKITYTTNAIENLNREIRRVSKTKGGWTSDKALLIQLHLSLERKASTWHKRIRGWASIKRELTELYGERFTKHFS